ncbi:nonspecific lipidtransfer protein [Acanthamoeba castellanii str. Neff]|uniref:Nonspecific lipidtransfer protein n=1 Tax=Acanthamoeba castellanii (strain ATCC 30010 / Neff) TaxID=1257118 RepID=L8GZN6_ACACF|nr:nonspecific lipidtransfer protein [Acanthamoeba castellanii str. Neff]ELR18704.1 nonspecific lipidtransfer protein [Acanthamoeba castellanii str. Neff]
MRGPKVARIVGVGMTPLGKHNKKPSMLMRNALELALGDAGMTLRQLDGLVAIPSLADPHFMEAHFLGTQMGLLPNKERDMDWCETVAVVAGDAVCSLSKEEFLRRADQTCQDPDGELQSPVIPNGYDRIAQWQMRTYGVTREQLAMCSVLMSMQAARHPYAVTQRVRSLEEVLASPPIGKVTNLLELREAPHIQCANHVDRWLERHGYGKRKGVVVLGGGEGSGPLYPPPVIDEDMFTADIAAELAFNEAQIGPNDIDFFGLYDCFPICFIRAIEAVGLAKKGEGGAWVEQKYYQLLKEIEDKGGNDNRDPNNFPVNTHGGLLAFGAPWEAPAMYNVIEAVEQLRGRAGSRQVRNAKRALVYANGGIFSASSIALLGVGHM